MNWMILMKRLIFNLHNHARTSCVDVLTGSQIHWFTDGRDDNGISLSGIIFSASTERSALPLAGAYGAPTFQL